MKIYVTTPTITLPPAYLKLALKSWFQDHPETKTAAMVRKGCYNDDMLYRLLGEQGVERINWSHYFREYPQYTEFTWDLIALRWESPDWVVIIEGEEEDERLSYTKEIAEKYDFSVSVISPHDRFDLSGL